MPNTDRILDIEHTKRKIQHYTRITNKLKEKLELHKIRNEDLEQQKETLKNNVPLEVHEQVLNKLTELQRRLDEYRFIVASEPHFLACSQAPASVPGKLLTDIQNLQLRFSPQKHLAERKKTGASTHPKRSLFSRRRSVKTRNQDPASTAISSSSDLDLENL